MTAYYKMAVTMQTIETLKRLGGESGWGKDRDDDTIFHGYNQKDIYRYNKLIRLDTTRFDLIRPSIR